MPLRRQLMRAAGHKSGSTKAHRRRKSAPRCGSSGTILTSQEGLDHAQLQALQGPKRAPEGAQGHLAQALPSPFRTPENAPETLDCTLRRRRPHARRRLIWRRELRVQERLKEGDRSHNPSPGAPSRRPENTPSDYPKRALPPRRMSSTGASKARRIPSPQSARAHDRHRFLEHRGCPVQIEEDTRPAGHP